MPPKDRYLLILLQTQLRMPFPTHIFDLPRELIFELLKRMDLGSIDNMERTCCYFKETVKDFKSSHRDVMTKKFFSERANIESSDDDDDYYYEDDDDSELESFGSNCDPDNFDSDDDGDQ